MLPEPHEGLSDLGWGRGSTWGGFPVRLLAAIDGLPMLVERDLSAVVDEARWLASCARALGQRRVAEWAALLSLAAERGQARLSMGLVATLRREAHWQTVAWSEAAMTPVEAVN
ncbi:hypothetical protein [Halomonas sp. 328]|uniref:hypothetical protein n=1 Tax=Halomonas sp. 328 TaxID=2776704 RepID=UPI0018A7E159|nr:hypothetical protein [Halomonas sp. 328]MBF8224478.1 hypothetical protein [Halomonas sp. 328]